MNEEKGIERRLFEAALELPKEERQAYLENQVADDPTLLGRLLALLEIEDSASRFMRTKAFAPGDEEETRRDVYPEGEGPGSVIGRYRLVELLGEGGFGRVYLAEQTEPLRRQVALKIIKPGMETRELVGRLQAERQALALMDHPNIAKALDAGTTELGHPYFVMELVSGVPITSYCDGRKMTVQDRLRLFLPVLQAVHHAHQKGIIHRDIKPSNVLVAESGEVPVPKVIDFGIAKALEQRLSDFTVLTQGVGMGTPAYMSPEQADGRSEDIDTRSDIYSLGALLYQLLVGRPPFSTAELVAEGVFAMRRRLLETDPAKPSIAVCSHGVDKTATVARDRSEKSTRLSLALRGDIDWIVMKAMEKEPSRRYETANAFREDLERHLNGEPVTAAAPSLGYRVGKFVRKHRAMTAAAAVLVFGLLIATIISTSAALRANQATEEKQANLYAADVWEAQSLLETGDLQGARALLEGHATSAERGWEWRFLFDQLGGASRTVIGGFGFGVTDTALSPDGRYLGGTSESGMAGVWDLKEKRLVWSDQSTFGRLDAGFSADGRYFGFSDWSLNAPPHSVLQAEIWDYRSSRRVWSSQGGTNARFGFSPLEALAAVAIGSSGIEIVGLGSFDSVSVVADTSSSLPHRAVGRIAISRDGKLAYGIEGGAYVEVIDIETKSVIRPKTRLNLDPNAPVGDEYSEAMHIGFNPSGDELWATYFYSSPIMLNVDSGEVSRPLAEGAADCHQIRFSRDGRWIAGAGFDHTARVWSADDFELMWTFRGHIGEVGGVEFHPDSQSVYSVGIGGNGDIYQWVLDEPSVVGWSTTYPPPSIPVRRSPVFSSSGKSVAIASQDLSVIEVDLESGEQKSTPFHGLPLGYRDQTGELVTLVPVESADRSVAIHRWSTDKADPKVLSIPGDQEFWARVFYKYSYNTKSDQLLITPSSPTTLLVDSVDGTLVEELEPRELDIVMFARSDTSGKRFLTIERDLEQDTDILLSVYDSSRRDRRPTNQARFQTAPGRGLFDAGFSPDGKWIAALSLSPSIYLFDTDKASMDMRVVGRHFRACQNFCFSPDSQSIVTVGDDKHLRVWSLRTERQLLSLKLDFSPATVGFSPHGDWLVVTGGESPWSQDRVQWWPTKASPASF